MVADRGEPVSLVAGAAMSPACSGASPFGSGLVEPMGEDGVGMRRSPAVGQHLVQPRVVCMQAQEKFAYLAPRLDPMTLRAGQNHAQHGRPRTCGFTAQEQPILASNGLVPTHCVTPSSCA